MPSIGQRLAGRYRLDARIGSGGFAAVFRARDLRLERDVAVKVLLANHATDPVVAARFEREARVLAAVNHPNVVAIHDVEAGDPTAGTEPFLVMDLCDRGSLADLLSASPSGSLAPGVLLPILIDIAAGLVALHAQGIVHRDLKPSNVLLSRGRAQIADLGIATAGPSELTATGTALGTLAYLAPEQLAGQPASRASDVHALGAIAFLGLTGRSSSPADNVAAFVAASSRAVAPVSAVAPGLGVGFDRPIAQALAHDPAGRPTAAAFERMLSEAYARWRTRPASSGARLAQPLAGVEAAANALTSDEPTTIVRVPLPRNSVALTAVTRRPKRQRSTVVGLGLLVAVVLVASAAALLIRGSAGTAGPSLAAVGSPSPSPSSAPPTSSPTPSPTVAPTPVPTPSPTADAYADARAASAALRAAIDASNGPGGLKGHDARDIETSLDQVDHALDQGDAGTARNAADRAQQQVMMLVDRNGFDPQAAAELESDANRLVAAVNALPSD
jgi:eukaryotic-like serine/threonine-protein kinase